MLEHDRHQMPCELQNLRRYAWKLFHEYERSVDELENIRQSNRQAL